MAAVLVLLFGLLYGASAVCTERHVVPMRDGVGLTVFLTIPEPCDIKRGAVLDASPYGPSINLISELYVPSGFIAVMQNQRGCFTSEGLYNFWKQDGEDHYDTMLWITNQTWYNGEIFTFGASADGISSYAGYTLDNPYAKGGYAIWASAYGHETCFWNGAYRGGTISHWLQTLGTCPNAPNIEVEVRQNEAYTEWWAPIEASGKYGNNFPNVKEPSIHQAAWWDVFLQPQIATVGGIWLYGDPSIRRQTWFWIIPLGHCSLNGFDYPGWEIADPQMQSRLLFQGNFSAPVWSYIGLLNFYVFGPVPAIKANYSYGNYYTSMDAWPTYDSVKYYVGPNGVLSTTAPTTAGSLTYYYDPSDPVPQRGGNNLYGKCGPNDERQNEARSDYLIWNLDMPFTEPMALCGELNATITVSSSAIDTDFIVSVNDIYPTGESIPVRYGPVRMRWRCNDTTPCMMTPGEQYTVTLSLWSTAYIFNPGHSMRVTITSSKSPEISVNPNNGKPLSEGLVPGDLTVAKNTVYWGPNQQSFVTLPIVPLSALPVNDKIR